MKNIIDKATKNQSIIEIVEKNSLNFFKKFNLSASPHTLVAYGRNHAFIKLRDEPFENGVALGIALTSKKVIYAVEKTTGSPDKWNSLDVVPTDNISLTYPEIIEKNTINISPIKGGKIIKPKGFLTCVDVDRLSDKKDSHSSFYENGITRENELIQFSANFLIKNYINLLINLKSDQDIKFPYQKKDGTFDYINFDNNVNLMKDIKDDLYSSNGKIEDFDSLIKVFEFLDHSCLGNFEMGLTKIINFEC